MVVFGCSSLGCIIKTPKWLKMKAYGCTVRIVLNSKVDLILKVMMPINNKESSIIIHLLSCA